MKFIAIYPLNFSRYNHRGKVFEAPSLELAYAKHPTAKTIKPLLTREGFLKLKDIQGYNKVQMLKRVTRSVFNRGVR